MSVTRAEHDKTLNELDRERERRAAAERALAALVIQEGGEVRIREGTFVAMRSDLEITSWVDVASGDRVVKVGPEATR